MPSARKTDPETSHDAARSIKEPKLSESRLAIVRIFRKHGRMNDESLAAYYASLMSDGSAPYLSPSGLRSRRSELVDMGYLTDTGLRAPTYSGRQSIVWKAVSRARAN